MLNFNLSDLEDEEYQSESSNIKLKEKETKREIINQVNPPKKLENDDQKKEPTIPKIDNDGLKKEERVDPLETKTLEELTEIQKEGVNPFFQVTDADLKDLSSAPEEIDEKIQQDIPAEQQDAEPIQMYDQQHSDNETFHTQTQSNNKDIIPTIDEQKPTILEIQNFSDELPFDLPILDRDQRGQKSLEKKFVLYNPKQCTLFTVIVGEKLKFKSQMNEELYRHKFDMESSFNSGYEDLPRVETDVNNLSSIIIKSVRQQLQKKEKRVSKPKQPFQMDLPTIFKSNTKRIRKVSESSNDSQQPQIEQRLIGQVKSVFGKKIDDDKILYFVKQTTSKNRKLKPQWLVDSEFTIYQDIIDGFEEKLDNYTYRLAKQSYNIQKCTDDVQKFRINPNGVEKIGSVDMSLILKGKPIMQELLDCSKIKILTPSMEVIAAMMMKSGVDDLSDFENERRKQKSKKSKFLQEETKIVEPHRSGIIKTQSDIRKQIFEGTYQRRKLSSKRQLEIEGKLVQVLKEDILKNQKQKGFQKERKNQKKLKNIIETQDQEAEQVQLNDSLDADMIVQSLDKRILEKLKVRSKEFVILNHFQYDGSGLLVQIQEKNQNYVCPAQDLLEFKAARLANYLKDKYIQKLSSEANQ